MSEELDIQKDLSIDKYRLDEEWVNLPNKIQRWEEKLLDEERSKDRLKDKIELEYSKLDLEIRSNPEKFQLEEDPTERMVRSAILRNEKYQKLQEEYIQAKYQVGVLKIAVRKIRTMEKTLERLTKLYLTGYYMKEYEPEQNKDENETLSYQARVRLNANMAVRRAIGKKHDG